MWGGMVEMGVGGWWLWVVEEVGGWGSRSFAEVVGEMCCFGSFGGLNIGVLHECVRPRQELRAQSVEWSLYFWTGFG